MKPRWMRVAVLVAAVCAAAIGTSFADNPVSKPQRIRLQAIDPQLAAAVLDLGSGALLLLREGEIGAACECRLESLIDGTAALRSVRAGAGQALLVLKPGEVGSLHRPADAGETAPAVVHVPVATDSPSRR